MQGFGRCHIGFTNYTTRASKVWTLNNTYSYWTIQLDMPSVGGLYQWMSQSNIAKCKSYESQPYSQSCPLAAANYPEESVGVTAFRRFCRFSANRTGAIRTFWGWTDYRYIKHPNGTEATVVRAGEDCVFAFWHVRRTWLSPQARRCTAVDPNNSTDPSKFRVIVNTTNFELLGYKARYNNLLNKRTLSTMMHAHMSRRMVV